jgi:hypothetical protein
MTETPVSFVYGIEWTINNGCPSATPLTRDSIFFEPVDGCIDDADALHTRFKWDSVECGYYVFDKPKDPLIGFYITGRAFKGTQDDLGNVVVVEYLENPVKFTISNGHPRDYGVELFTDTTKCGIVDGSEYDYMEVFDQTDFEYLPMNSGNTTDTFTGPVKVDKEWPLEPMYPDVKDPLGKAAPIFPMDIITRFVPDPRLSVTITYNITGTILPIKNETPPVALNPDVTLKHVVVQAETDYKKQLDMLSTYTMYANGNDFDYSPDYPYSYPYTTVSNREPSYDAQRGDVWYNPENNVRKYYSIGDIPENLTVVNKGKNYRKTKGVECVWQPKELGLDLIDREIPYGLLVDLELNNGTVENVSISADALPKGWIDGDEVVIQGGNNQARLRINIQNPAAWVDSYIFKR